MPEPALVLALAAAAAASGNWRLLVAIPIAGYGFAWFSHAAVERNRPATFTYPFWSLAADFRMAWLWIDGAAGRRARKSGGGAGAAEGFTRCRLR